MRLSLLPALELKRLNISEIELYRKKTKVVVPRNSASAITFIIATLKEGQVEIKISASSSGNVDTVTKYLTVSVSCTFDF